MTAQISHETAWEPGDAHTSPASVKVWDLFVRAFHWSLVASFALAFLTGDEMENLHMWAGYAAAGLVALRLVWGLIGPRYARFTQFVKSPASVVRYIGDVATGREARYVGHNPAGGVMVVALLAMLVGLSVTGILMTTPAYWHSESLEDVHEVVANLMLGLVVLHLAGVILASIRHHENLVHSMITGRKRAPEADDVS
ncbi:MAG: cytochrome b/b6 domain-containing protein [Hyphomicrobium sp.]|uniref:cytochrome b/b6 domain-containing protein n=1 Tax=Hyphomicrobium sp. TaxID=82 RepID=UPI003D0CDA32